MFISKSYRAVRTIFVYEQKKMTKAELTVEKCCKTERIFVYRKKREIQLHYFTDGRMQKDSKIVTQNSAKGEQACVLTDE